MKRWDIINHLITRNNFQKYLEIGIYKGKNFNNITCNMKIGIDPKPKYKRENIFKITSDNYFKNSNEKFDVIFIDGDHSFYQSLVDIKNSFNALSYNGFVVCHDCFPVTKKMEKHNKNGRVWNSFFNFVEHDVEISKTSYVIDCDYGIGVIRKQIHRHINLHDDVFVEKEYNTNFDIFKKKYILSPTDFISLFS